MRFARLIAVMAIAAVAWSCGGGDSNEPAAARARVTTTAPATAKTAATDAAQSTQQASGVEVTGIVGSVSANTRTIEINRLSGAAVTKITLESTTMIRKAGGGTATLAQIRPSDRIVARGELDDRKETLVATEITVQGVVPGAQPGG